MSISSSSKFVVATPGRSVCDDNARALERIDKLRFIALGTRRGIAGVPQDRTRLNPWIGLKTFLAAKMLSPFAAESFRFGLSPEFDRWVLKQLHPGDHIISSYGYVNECFRLARRHGGKTLVDAGNSHIENFLEILSEEHGRWNCPTPPLAPILIERAREMLSQHTDYVLSPSNYVTNSFLTRGFKPEQILRNVYPINLDCFRPSNEARPKNRPLTIINTGSLSLRKGTPYLLEAFRILRRSVPDARLMLTRLVEDSVRPVLGKYSDLPIDWSPPLPPAQLAGRLRSADIFVLPSLEEGLARTSVEAMACGLPIIVTSHTGSNDFVTAGSNGEVVPIRDAPALAEAILRWRDKLMSSSWKAGSSFDLEQFSFNHFAEVFLRQLRAIGIIS